MNLSDEALGRDRDVGQPETGPSSGEIVMLRAAQEETRKLLRIWRERAEQASARLRAVEEERDEWKELAEGAREQVAHLWAQRDGTVAERTVRRFYEEEIAEVEQHLLDAEKERDDWRRSAEGIYGTAARQINELRAERDREREVIQLALAELSGVRPEEKYERECYDAAVSVLQRALSSADEAKP